MQHFHLTLGRHRIVKHAAGDFLPFEVEANALAGDAGVIRPGAAGDGADDVSTVVGNGRAEAAVVAGVGGDVGPSLGGDGDGVAHQLNVIAVQVARSLQPRLEVVAQLRHRLAGGGGNVHVGQVIAHELDA
jgi:hypothetical protein